MENVIIVGSGPAACTAGIYLARAGLSPLMLTGISAMGGALMNTTHVENFPGFVDGIQGPDLMESMQNQATKFGTKVVYDEVESFDLDSDVKTVKTLEGNEYSAKALVLCMGADYKRLGVKGESEFSGKGVSYCATCDGFFFKGKELIVAGGGDSALQEALFLSTLASKVTIVHRRDKFRASKVMESRVRANEKIELALDSSIAEIQGDNGKVSSVLLENTKTRETTSLNADGVFVAIGHKPATEILKGKIELDAQGYALVDGRSSKTSVKGVFAAGNMVDNVYRQAITAAAAGCTAALDAEEYLEASIENFR
jgi:thioredoxin reductase (NADPH)